MYATHRTEHSAYRLVRSSVYQHGVGITSCEMGEISGNFHGKLVVAMEITCWKSPLGRPEIYTKAKPSSRAPHQEQPPSGAGRYKRHHHEQARYKRGETLVLLFESGNDSKAFFKVFVL